MRLFVLLLTVGAVLPALFRFGAACGQRLGISAPSWGKQAWTEREQRKADARGRVLELVGVLLELFTAFFG